MDDIKSSEIDDLLLYKANKFFFCCIIMNNDNDKSLIYSFQDFEIVFLSQVDFKLIS